MAQSRQSWQKQQGGYGLIAGIVGLLLAILISALLLRFIFRLIGLEPTNAPVAWIYNFTTPLITPFAGILNPTINLPTGQLEIDTIIAIVIYGVIGTIIQRVLP